MSIVDQADIIQKTSKRFLMHLKDGGVAIPNLASATTITFVLHKNDEATPTITEVWTGIGSNPKMVVDTPSVGDVQVDLTSTDLDIEPGTYHLSVQVVWAPGSTQEFPKRDFLWVSSEIIEG